MIRHTPGPWTLEPQARRVIGPIAACVVADDENKQIALITPTNMAPQEMQANARLIIAAPDTLNALKDLCATMRAVMKHAEEQIAKAEGRRP